MIVAGDSADGEDGDKVRKGLAQAEEEVESVEGGESVASSAAGSEAGK